MTASTPFRAARLTESSRPSLRGAVTLRRATAALVIVFMALASWYSVVVPAFEAPDETIHVEFITHLARGNGLPVLPTEGYGPAGQEAAQPPLYYLLGAAATLAAPPPETEPV
ncbi:MAG: hypothetical protein NZ518_02805, partial [Dehalococcoidia bacterium]|nr:hypothetical protein [Dehalococcoidia bacterium]